MRNKCNDCIYYHEEKTTYDNPKNVRLRMKDM